MRELDPAAFQDLGRPGGLAAAGTKPAAHALSRELLEPRERAAHFRFLVLDLLQRALEPAVADEVPAGFGRAFGAEA